MKLIKYITLILLIIYSIFCSTIKINVMAAMPEKIAIVNNDEGINKNNEQINYGKEILAQYEGIEFINYGAAKLGINNGTYQSYIIIPNDFSKNIETIDTSLTKSIIAFEISTKLNNNEKQKATNNVLNLIQDINADISKMYLNGILKEFYRGQTNAARVIENDNLDRSAIQEIANMEFLTELDLKELEIPDAEISQPEFNSWKDGLNKSYELIQKEYETLNENILNKYNGVDSKADSAVEKLKEAYKEKNKTEDNLVQKIEKLEVENESLKKENEKIIEYFTNSVTIDIGDNILHVNRLGKVAPSVYNNNIGLAIYPEKGLKATLIITNEDGTKKTEELNLDLAKPENQGQILNPYFCSNGSCEIMQSGKNEQFLNNDISNLNNKISNINDLNYYKDNLNQRYINLLENYIKGNIEEDLDVYLENNFNNDQNMIYCMNEINKINNTNYIKPTDFINDFKTKEIVKLDLTQEITNTINKYIDEMEINNQQILVQNKEITNYSLVENGSEDEENPGENPDEDKPSEKPELTDEQKDAIDSVTITSEEKDELNKLIEEIKTTINKEEFNENNQKLNEKLLKEIKEMIRDYEDHQETIDKLVRENDKENKDLYQEYYEKSNEKIENNVNKLKEINEKTSAENNELMSDFINRLNYTKSGGTINLKVSDFITSSLEVQDKTTNQIIELDNKKKFNLDWLIYLLGGIVIITAGYNLYVVKKNKEEESEEENYEF